MVGEIRSKFCGLWMYNSVFHLPSDTAVEGPEKGSEAWQATLLEGIDAIPYSQQAVINSTKKQISVLENKVAVLAGANTCTRLRMVVTVQGDFSLKTFLKRKRGRGVGVPILKDGEGKKWWSKFRH